MMNKQNITNINARRDLLLTPADVMYALGIGRANAMRIMHLYGFRLGSRYYITREKLMASLNDACEDRRDTQ